MDAPASLTGQYLLAMPGIGDPRFERAVIAMCAHDEHGALGVGVDRILPGITFHHLLEQLGIEPGVAPDCGIHIGGPVEQQRGFVLHSTEWTGEDSLLIEGRWMLTSTLDVLRAISAGEGPRRWLVALGYAGWGEGQLDGEMRRHGWLATRGNDELLFGEEPSRRWEQAMRSAGIDPRLLAATSGQA
ncbi:MAG: YqgE/AlgH family protein [Rhizorhabdus sp.]